SRNKEIRRGISYCLRPDHKINGYEYKFILDLLNTSLFLFDGSEWFQENDFSVSHSDQIHCSCHAISSFLLASTKNRQPLQPAPQQGLQKPPGDTVPASFPFSRSEEHTSELQSRFDLVCRLLLEKIQGNKPIISACT